jgi:CHASE2 domain-containing sensor protein
MRGFAEYLASCLLIIAIIGAIAWALTSDAGQRAVLTSAALALAVQVVAFSVTRALQRRNLLLGWGLGSVLRLIALVTYAMLVAKRWHTPLTPALLSFVAFVFVTTVVEPVFLKR